MTASTHSNWRWISLGCATCIALTSSACETIQSRYVAVPIDIRGKQLAGPSTGAGIVVSGEELTELSAPLFGVLEITFENHSDRWAHLDGLALQFGSNAVNQAVYVPAGPDLEAWAEATVKRNVIRQRNTALALQLISIGSQMAKLGAGHHRSEALAADMISIASHIALQANAAAARDEATLFPNDHLFDGPISVPPRLFAKRWIVLHTPEPRVTGCLRRLRLGYRLADGRVEYVALPFRGEHVNSEWQADLCNRPITGSVE